MRYRATRECRGTRANPTGPPLAEDKYPTRLHLENPYRQTTTFYTTASEPNKPAYTLVVLRAAVPRLKHCVNGTFFQAGHVKDRANQSDSCAIEH